MGVCEPTVTSETTERRNAQRQGNVPAAAPPRVAAVRRAAPRHERTIGFGRGFSWLLLKISALAVFLARQRVSTRNIKVAITERFGYDLERTPDDIRPTYRFNETCQETVPQALVCVLTATSFEDAIRNAISIGGDSDTVAAIAGGVAEALFGIPDEIASQGWSYLPKDMREVLTGLYREAGALV